MSNESLLAHYRLGAPCIAFLRWSQLSLSKKRQAAIFELSAMSSRVLVLYSAIAELTLSCGVLLWASLWVCCWIVYFFYIVESFEISTPPFSCFLYRWRAEVTKMPDSPVPEREKMPEPVWRREPSPMSDWDAAGISFHLDAQPW